MNARLEWKPADCWVGLYTERRQRKCLWHADSMQECTGRWERHVWLCLLPMLPLHLWWGEEA